MKTVKQKNVFRNPLHDHPLMKRGGVHEKTKKAQRQQDKQQLKKLWRYLRVEIDLFLNKATGKGKDDGR
ncbi:MAG: hypothetical protein OEY09_11240 [Gammaproteobacteria bacterium]|nr:hypothetical protein [Gammaproteobacteria bacterium]